jgi:hypothetical protein
MTEDGQFTPTRLAQRARRMKRLNVPMRFVLGLPFTTPLSSQLMLITHTGRKSGRVYRQPVSYVAAGGGKWKLNLREGEPTPARLRGRDVRLRPEFVRDSVEVDRLLHHMLARNPRLTSFVPFIDQDGTIDRGKLETALNHGFCIVRWRLDSAPS